MIKCEKGAVQFEGRGIYLLAEYSGITQGVFKMLLEDGLPEDKVREVMQECFDIAFLSDEEMVEKSAEAKKKFKEKIIRELDEVFGD